MRALGNCVLIEPALGEIVEEKGVAGRKIVGSKFVKPVDTDQTKPTEGIIHHVGPESNLGLKVADRVLFRGWTGIETRVNGVTVVITEQKNVLALVDDGDRLD